MFTPVTFSPVLVGLMYYLLLIPQIFGTLSKTGAGKSKVSMIDVSSLRETISIVMGLD